MEIEEIFSRNLKYYRFKRGYSQEKLAELSDLSARIISDYERCISAPLITTVGDIAKALGVEYFQLFETKYINIKLEDRVDIHLRLDKK